MPARVLAHAAVALLLMLTLAACGVRARQVDTRQVSQGQRTYHVVTLHLRHDRLQLLWHRPGSDTPFGNIESLRSWAEQHGKRLLFAANAGIYDSRYAPLGLFIRDGHTLVPLNRAHGDPRAGNFSMRPNGVFSIDTHGHASVQTTQAYAAGAQHPRLATQSGPMLVIDGRINPAFHPASDSLKWRSGVCARGNDTVLFAISEAPVNFYDFARLFRDTLHCSNALYLDGTISQFYANGDYHGAPSLVVRPYAGIFAVFGPLQR